MHVDDCSGLTDRQARAAIVAAEARGFLREPDLYEIWYHHLLHEDARYAVEHLRTHDPDALQEALIADECICPHCAALAITEASGFSLGQADLLVEAALERGFTPPSPGLPLTDWALRFDQGRAAAAYFWEEGPAQLRELIDDLAQVAPLPPERATRARTSGTGP